MPTGVEWNGAGVYLAPLGVVPDPSSSFDATFLQYGVLGAVALLLGYFALNAVKRERQSTDTERARADRLEEQLRTLNETVQSQTMKALNDATKAVAEALLTVEAARRDYRREQR